MKTLLDKIGKRIRNGILVVTALTSIGLAGCPIPGPDPKPPVPPSPPKAELSVDPVSGYKPLNVDIELNGTNGSNSIKDYTVTIDYTNPASTDETITQSTPIILHKTFNENAAIRGQVTDTQGNFDKENRNVVVSDVPIVDYLDVEGWLQDNETQTGKQGLVKILDSANLTNPIETVLADPTTGHFVFHSTTKKVSDLSGVVLRAISTDASNSQSSYVRTKTFPAGDVSVNPIRVVPYVVGWTQIEINNFIEHMRRLNFWHGGLQKWNHGELPDDSSTTYSHPIFKGIQISNNFLPAEQDSIENAIRNSGYKNAGNINIVRGENHYLELGWGFIRLSNPGEAPGTYVYEQNGADGYIERFLTNLDHLQAKSKGLVGHEADGHGLLYPGHADDDNVAALFNSIMKYTSYDIRYSPPQRPEVFTDIDRKGNDLIDNPDYIGMEQESGILGTTF